MEKKDKLELLSIKRDITRNTNKLFAIGFMLNKLKPGLSKDWEQHFEMMNKNSLELSELNKKIADLERELGIQQNL